MRIESNTPALSRKLLREVMHAEAGSDHDLLARFVAARDQDAFAELVRRHGRMVLAVTRRVTGHSQDAEDAFQATFLVLARRSSQISQPEQLANWLYGVAYRTAREARAARRRVLEHSVSSIPEYSALVPQDESAELRRVIDEELAALPEKYRAAVVLCELEGLSRKDAARQLRIPEGTLSSRLAYARKLLASRLVRRGFTTTASGVALVLGREAASGTLSRELVHRVAGVAVMMTGGKFPADLLSPSVSHLTEGVLKVMFISRLRASILMAALACGFLSAGAYGLAQFVPASAPQGDRYNGSSVNDQPRPDNQQYPAGVKDKHNVPARGIEDEDVPYGTLPMQAVVRLENGKLIIRHRVPFYEPVTHQFENGRVTMYELRSRIYAYNSPESPDLAVFDIKGNRLAQKIWKEKLKSDLHALISFDGKLPNPRDLTLFRDDVLVIVVASGIPNANRHSSNPPPVTVQSPVPGEMNSAIPSPLIIPTTPPPIPSAPEHAMPGFVPATTAPTAPAYPSIRPTSGPGSVPLPPMILPRSIPPADPRNSREPAPLPPTTPPANPRPTAPVSPPLNPEEPTGPRGEL